MNKMTNSATLAASIAAALLLTACGGGGGSAVSTDSAPGSTTTTTVATTTTTTVASSIVSNVNPANYGAGSNQRTAYDYLNAQRNACGFGLLQQSTQIDQAAQAHADYLSTNNVVNTHFENQQQFPTGFTGVQVNDRLIAAGYQPTVSTEVITGPITASMFGLPLGEEAVRHLMAAPYHGMGVLGGTRDIGVGVNNRGDYVINLGATVARSVQSPSTTDVLTYPCAGLTNVITKTYGNENPSPITGRNLQTQPIGHPIYVKVRDGQTLNLTAVDLRIDGSNTAVTLNTLNSDNDANNLITPYAGKSLWILMPNTPLQANAMYRFTATGTNNGQPVNINFTFTTGGF